MPVNVEVKGNVPKWLKGSIVRNGPGVFAKEHVHLFDGYAFLVKFEFDNGQIKTQQRKSLLPLHSASTDLHKSQRLQNANHNHSATLLCLVVYFLIISSWWVWWLSNTWDHSWLFSNFEKAESQYACVVKIALATWISLHDQSSSLLSSELEERISKTHHSWSVLTQQCFLQVCPK